MIKKSIVTIVCLALCIGGVGIVSAKEPESVKTLPPVVAQAYGVAGTIIMWHTVDGDEKPDYQATYVFKDGRLYLISQIMTSQADPRYQIIGR